MSLLDVLKRVAKAKATRDVLKFLLGALAGYASQGCGLVGAKHPEFDVLECQVDALADVVPRAAAEDLAMAARSGNYDYVVKQLLRLDIDPGAIEAAAEAFGACEKLRPDLDAPVPSVLERS